MGAEDGEVKRPLSEKLLKSGYMSVEEDRTNVHADIDNYHLLKRVGGGPGHLLTNVIAEEQASGIS